MADRREFVGLNTYLSDFTTLRISSLSYVGMA